MYPGVPPPGGPGAPARTTAGVLNRQLQFLFRELLVVSTFVLLFAELSGEGQTGRHGRSLGGDTWETPCAVSLLAVFNHEWPKNLECVVLLVGPK